MNHLRKINHWHLIYLLHFTVGSLDSPKFGLYLMFIFWLLCWLFLFVLLFYLHGLLSFFSLPELQGGKNYMLLQAKVLDIKKDKKRRNLLGIKSVGQTVIFSTEVVLTYLNCCLLNHIAWKNLPLLVIFARNMFSSSSISDEGKYSSAELSSDSQGIEVVFFSWRGYKRKEKKHNFLWLVWKKYIQY